MKAGSQDSSNPQTTAEDETLKRNTDCVYFLASPLTCKKGSECEYRHSEDARMNPRDCWYWMNGNCLNPKCSFRHPPLDGLLGTAVTTSTRSSLPPSLAAAPTQLSTPHNPASNLGKQANPHKQATPCYYFQKGLCLKGDRCPFMHEPLSVDSSVPQPPAAKVAISVTESQIPKKAFGSLQSCSTQQQKFQQGNTIKPVEVPHAAKPPAKPEIALSKNGIAVKKTAPQTNSYRDELPRYKPPNVPPVISADSVSRTHRSRQAYPLDYPSFQNGKEPDEFLAESSPGFDVLVDDELRDSDYYHNEDEFGRMKGHEGRHANTVNEFDYKRSSDYTSVGKFDQETYNDSRSYDLYGRMQDQYVQEQRRPSSERTSERPIERRGFSRAESPSQVDRSDLRYRLSKHRKVNGSRSAVSPDRRGEFYRRDDRDRNVGDQRFRDHSRRDTRSSIPRESSIISNRLQGRIKLPGRSSPDNHYNDSHKERETDGGINRGRLSPPGRLPASSPSQGRLQDRIKRRTPEDFTTEGRNFRGPPIKRDEVDNNTLNFAGPKSLAELKGSKVSNENHQKNTETRKLVSYQESEGSPSFEGPKPLNVILKRKREAGTAGSGDDTFSGNEEETNQRRKGLLTSSRSSGVAEKQSEMPFESKIEEAHRSKEDDLEEEEGLISAEGDDVTHEDHSFEQKGADLQEEDVIMADKLEEQEFESYDQRDGEYDYEPVEGGDFKTEEDDVNADAEEDFSDDEDGDDFAKRIGVMFS
ncbi:zinc finger protein [Macleaya cordata]|uniref:Zinc finger protein n=1 Tax=Macleaya cordata TaxID=56857 RepID=A0A200QBR4_MACCD|nr:zinc finger protein [Macleaya cordata]